MTSKISIQIDTNIHFSSMVGVKQNSAKTFFIKPEGAGLKLLIIIPGQSRP